MCIVHTAVVPFIEINENTVFQWGLSSGNHFLKYVKAAM